MSEALFFLCLGGGALFSASVASISNNRKAIVFSLWLTGFFLSAIYIQLGFELIAVLQGILVTVVSFVILFSTALFGEYQQKKNLEKKTKNISFLLRPLLMVAAPGLAIFWIRKLPEDVYVPELLLSFSVQEVSRVVTVESFLSLLVLGIFFVFVAVGVGIVSRPEMRLDNTKNKGDPR